MTNTTPITAHDLAEALREAESILALIEGTCGLDDEHDQARVAFGDLLDRYDAQVRERLEDDIAYAILQRDGYMRWARKQRTKPAPDPDVRSMVDDAHMCNWQALRLRRELRRLGGEG